MKKFTLATLVLAIAGVIFSILSLLPEPADKNNLVQTRERNIRNHRINGTDHGTFTTLPKDESKKHPYADIFPEMPDIADYRTYNPETITVAIEKDLPITFIREKTYMDHGRRVWVGTNPASKYGFYISAGDQQEYYAIVELAPGANGVHIKNNIATSFFNDKPINCQNTETDNPTGSVLNATTVNPAGTTATVAAADTASVVVDLSFFIDQATIDKCGGAASALTQTIAELAASNKCLTNSQITGFSWALADFVPIPKSMYTFSNDMGIDLGKMINTPNQVGTLANLVKTTMTASGSDEAMLMVTGGGSWGGMAWVGGQYGMVRFDQLFYHTLTHEMGHNFGCVHDRITDKATTTNPSRYNYGYMVDNGFMSGGKYYSYYYGDLMSYAPFHFPMFSNPKCTFDFRSNGNDHYGEYGTKQSLPAGIEVGDELFAANTARTMTEAYAKMAAMGTRKEHINIQPADTYVLRDASSYLLTSIDNPNATYQWYRNEVAIAGATDPKYSFSGTDNTKGTYHCVVTTEKGSYKSKVVTVQVAGILPQEALILSLPSCLRYTLSCPLATTGGSGSGAVTYKIISGPAQMASDNVSLYAYGVGQVAIQAIKASDDTYAEVKSAISYIAARPLVATFTGNLDYPTANIGRTLAPRVLPKAQYCNISYSSSNSAIVSVDSSTGNISALKEGTATITATGTPSSKEYHEFDPIVASISVNTLVSVTTAQSHLINISTKSMVKSGQATQVSGFVVTGTAPKKVLIRAGGPALAKFNISNYLPNPFLTLYDKDSKAIASNDDWDYSAVNEVANSIYAYGWTKGSKDAAILTTLQPGLYSAQVTDPNKGTGINLIEIYDADPNNQDSHLINISTRSLANADSEAQTAGFVISGDKPRKVLIRAGGPALKLFAITDTIADPQITLFDGKNIQINYNDNWNSSLGPVAKSTYAYDFTSGSKDAAIAVELQPGSYTAVVSPKTGTSGGINLVEVYEVDDAVAIPATQ